MKKAFTIIELIFVIVILGILSAVALPKFAKTKELADISKARSDVAAIRSSILTERQSQLIKGNNLTPFIPKLSPTGATTGSTLFTGNGTRKLMTYGIVAGSSSTVPGKWTVVASTGELQYNFRVDEEDILFKYYTNNNTDGEPDGTFSCDRDDVSTGATCKKLVD